MDKGYEHIIYKRNTGVNKQKVYKNKKLFSLNNNYRNPVYIETIFSIKLMISIGVQKAGFVPPFTGS